MQSKLNKQVANKELSEKLWELGIRVDSLFYHCEDTIYFHEDINLLAADKIPALTSSELGFILANIPDDIEVPASEEYMNICKEAVSMKEEANDRARIVIYLIEQGLVKVDEINKQLN